MMMLRAMTAVAVCVSVGLLPSCSALVSCDAEQEGACFDTVLLQSRVVVGGDEPQAPGADSMAVVRASDALGQTLAQAIEQLDSSVARMAAYTHATMKHVRARIASPDEGSMQKKLEVFERVLTEALHGYLQPWGAVEGQIERLHRVASDHMEEVAANAHLGLNGLRSQVDTQLGAAHDLAEQVQSAVRRAQQAIRGVSTALQPVVLQKVDGFIAELSSAMGSVDGLVESVEGAVTTLSAAVQANLSFSAGTQLSGSVTRAQFGAGKVLKGLTAACSEFFDGLTHDFGKH